MEETCVNSINSNLILNFSYSLILYILQLTVSITDFIRSVAVYIFGGVVIKVASTDPSMPYLKIDKIN